MMGNIHFTNIDTLDLFIEQHKVEDVSLLKKWRFAWVLDNAKRFNKPIPYTHPKGAVIWVKLDLHNE